MKKKKVNKNNCNSKMFGDHKRIMNPHRSLMHEHSAVCNCALQPHALDLSIITLQMIHIIITLFKSRARLVCDNAYYGENDNRYSLHEKVSSQE